MQVVEIYVVYTQRIFFLINWWQIFENRSTLAKVINKHQVAYIFLRNSVDMQQQQY